MNAHYGTENVTIGASDEHGGGFLANVKYRQALPYYVTRKLAGES